MNTTTTSAADAPTGRGALASGTVVRLLLVAVVSLGLVAAAVAPQLSARLSGEEIALRVEPLDPIDPFRGAYVALSYPDLQRNDSEGADGAGLGSMEDGERGDVFVTLERDGEAWRAASFSRERPDTTPYLACTDRGWQIDCGIDSWFLPQDEAAALERDVAGGTVIATVRVDGRGHAALVDLGAPS